ncbi:MAG: MmgE/PrpD family protein [Candidatus Rokubacteria bacterium]|nr:MmgE/PrpD family protein [Candidatus Rokubacteria bacterium]
MTAGYLDTLAEFAATTDIEKVPDGVVDATTRIVLDTLGVIVAAAPAPPLRRFAREVTEREGTASLLGHDARSTPELAALVNGTAANWVELDEGNHTTLGHVGIHVIPAVLALAESRGCSGRELLTAVLAGYEVGARVARMGRLRWHIHPHGTWGAMAGAVACARLLGLPAPAIREALGIASSLALVTSRRTIAEGASVKYLWTGVASQHALQAVRFAHCGFTAEADGPASLFCSISDAPIAGREVVGDLGLRWEVEHAYFKTYACCRYAAPSVEAMLTARADGLDPDVVTAIDVDTFGLAAHLDTLQAHHELSARFSIPYCVAAAAVLGSCGPEAFRDATRADARVLALGERVRVHEVPAYTAEFPSATPARVTVRLRDGSVRQAEVRHAHGDPQRPLDAAGLRRKFHALTAGVLGAGAEDAARAILDVASTPDVRTITARLRGTAS